MILKKSKFQVLCDVTFSWKIYIFSIINPFAAENVDERWAQAKSQVQLPGLRLSPIIMSYHLYTGTHYEQHIPLYF